jgi:hypothetical protein
MLKEIYRNLKTSTNDLVLATGHITGSLRKGTELMENSVDNAISDLKLERIKDQEGDLEALKAGLKALEGGLEEVTPKKKKKKKNKAKKAKTPKLQIKTAA